MTQLLLITLLMLSCGPAYAEWVEVTGNDQGDVTVYANPDTIRRKEEMVTMWVLFDLKTIRTVGGHSYLSIKGQEKYDCDGERSQTLSFTEFSENMGRGNSVYSTSREGTWVPVVQESVSEPLLRFACSKK